MSLVVTGHDAAEVGKVAAAHGVRAATMHMRQGDDLLGTTAIGALPNAGVLVVLADKPLITAIFDQVIAAFRAGKGESSPVYRQQRGHPVLFGRRFFPALAPPPGAIAGWSTITP